MEERTSGKSVGRLVQVNPFSIPQRTQYTLAGCRSVRRLWKLWLEKFFQFRPSDRFTLQFMLVKVILTWIHNLLQVKWPNMVM